MFSFTKSRTAVDFCPYVRRICDLTTPELGSANGRNENRYRRSIPTVLCPWENGEPDLSAGTICVTSDLSDHGAQLLLDQPFRAEQVVLGYWLSREAMEEPWFMLGNVRRMAPIGGGYWILGVELTEFANTEHKIALMTLAEFATRLLPPN